MLDNIKHEKFCQAVITSPNPTQAYLETYDSSTATATVNSSKLLSNTNIKSRVVELLNESRLGVDHLTRRLGKWINDDEQPATSLKAIETGYKLHGLLSGEDDAVKQAQQLNVNVQIIGKQS